MDEDTKSSRQRRSRFCYLLTAACLVGAMLLALSGKDTETAHVVAREMLSIVDTVLWVYLPVSATDRSGVLHALAARFSGGEAKS